MHEFSLATQIVESVSEFAESHHISKVLEVRLLIGELTCVEAGQLRFCFNSITHGTVLEGSRLDIDPVAAGVKCAHCDYEGPPKYWDQALAASAVPTLQCPRCGNAATAVLGHECEIDSIQFVNGQPAGATH